MDYYSVIKRNEVLIYATTSMNLENNILGERSQSKKDYMFHLYMKVQNWETCRDRK